MNGSYVGDVLGALMFLVILAAIGAFVLGR